MSQVHKPVLLKEVVEALNVRKGEKYIDATVGMGGHAAEILKRGGKVLGIDCDPEAIEILKSSLREFLSGRKKTRFFQNRYSRRERDKKLILVKGNFKNLKQIAKKHGLNKVAGILFDLGLSSWQIEKSGRGFSYLKDEPLDMRTDLSLRLTAADIINTSTKEELYEIFARFGEEVHSWAITNALVSARPIKTTGQLVNVVSKVISASKKKNKSVSQKRLNHCLARVFQALRIVVNDELYNLRNALLQAVELLEEGGRLVVICFHSLEDRIVKLEFKKFVLQSPTGAKNLKIITKKPIRPSKEEMISNPRARSARLRIAEQI